MSEGKELVVADGSVDEKLPAVRKSRKKPDLGYLPRQIWLDRRIKRICKAIAEGDAVHKEWEDELFETMKDEREHRFLNSAVHVTI